MSVSLPSIAVIVVATIGLVVAEDGRADEAPRRPIALELGRPVLPALSDAASYLVPPPPISWSSSGRAEGSSAGRFDPPPRSAARWTPLSCGGADGAAATDSTGAGGQPTISTLVAPRGGSPTSDLQFAEARFTESAAPRTARGIGGTRLRASVAFLAPDTVNVGLFHPVGDRLTVGVLGQSLTQERTVEIGRRSADVAGLGPFTPRFSITSKTTAVSFGPFAQVRILEERRNRPSLEFTAYALEWGELTSASTQKRYSDQSILDPGTLARRRQDAAVGEEADKYRTVFLSASKRLPVSEDSTILRGVHVYGGAGLGVRTGKRYAVVQTDDRGDIVIGVLRNEVTRYSFVGWAGVEVSLPERLSLFGEFFTGDGCNAGYAAGLRWTSPVGITLSIGFSNCLESAPQRALDVVALPYDPFGPGINGLPSVVSSSGGSDSGGVGRPSSLDDDE